MEQKNFTLTGFLEGNISLMKPCTKFERPFYGCELCLSMPDTEAMIPVLDAAMAEATALPRKGMDKLYKPYGINPDGTLTITLKSSATAFTRKGEPAINTPLPIVNENLELLPDGMPEFQKGDIIKVDVELKLWSAKFGRGLSVQMKMVQAMSYSTGEPEDEPDTDSPF